MLNQVWCGNLCTALLPCNSDMSLPSTHRYTDPLPFPSVHTLLTHSPPLPLSQVHSNRSMWVAEMGAGFVNSKTTAAKGQ